ncbi:MAG: hypothetical protein NTU98_08190 [Bacteroidetes bacterium]|nr:hypothetical protein [Bacteroidota bacterium]
MEEEKVIEFTDDEILMIRSFCQDTLALEPQNALLANSILAKLSGAELTHIPTKKRGRPRKISTEIQLKVLPKPEPEPIEVTSESPVLVEEQVQEPQPLNVPDNPEMTQPETEQPIITVASNPKLSFLQLLLQKIRPAVRL